VLATIARPKDARPSPARAVALPASTGTARPAHRVGFLLPIAIALAAALAALLLGAVSPPPVLGGTSLDARCDGASLRSKPSSSSHREARLPRDARVVATKVVRGGRWATSCGGNSRDGRTWYRIVSVNGKAVSKLYGQKAVFGAKGVFTVVSIPLESACGGVRLRTDARTTAPSRMKLPAGTRVVASGTVSGGKWTADCDGRSSGNGWYRITRIGDKSVSSLFGVKALYAARGLWTRQGVEIPPPPDTSGYIEGIDVSHWQGTIDWVQVAGAGKRFAFMKASEGQKYVDPTYVTNRAQANINGIRVGAYHFAKPGTETGDAVAEADHFIATASWASGDLLPVLDLEVTGGLGTGKLQTWTKTFLDRIYNRTGVKAMIYTSPSFWKNNMGDTQSFAAAGYRTLWIAHWTTLASPSIPAANWGGTGWTFWQYTSDGSVPGIQGRVDLDRYRYASFDRVSVP
jgi:GH25 family lysozyme M1 (1,4-beta-N-acetylmuramidase)